MRSAVVEGRGGVFGRFCREDFLRPRVSVIQCNFGVFCAFGVFAGAAGSAGSGGSAGLAGAAGSAEIS